MFIEIYNSIKDIPGWLSLEVCELLHDSAKSHSMDGDIVEIGSWQGKSTVLLAKSLSKPNSKVYAIDPHKGSQEHIHLYGDIDTFERFQANLKKYDVDEKVVVIREYSKDAINKIPNKISMLWIDGSHEYPDVKSDFELYFPKLKLGGIVLFHDSKWQGVKKVLWESVYTNPSLGFVQRVEDTTFAVKRKPNEDLVYYFNLCQLKMYQTKQIIKRNKRKFKKKFSKVECFFSKLIS